MIEEVRIRPLATPALLLGIGLGGFIDGILLHPIGGTLLQLVLWLVTLAGVVMLFLAARRDDVVWSARVFAGTMLFGWGLFNFVEGIVNHFVLRLHHVHPGAHQLAWDIAFVVVGGIGFMLAGYLLGRSEISRNRMSPATRRALAL